MPLNKKQKEWAQKMAEAFVALENAESIMCSLGRELRGMFASVEEMKEKGVFDDLRLAFKEAYIASGKKEANVPGNWARVLYQYAFPGTAMASGKYYKDDGEGGVVLDKERNMPTPPGSAQTLAPRYLRNMPTITPAEVVELGGFPLRLIVAAGSGGGKTTFVRQILEALLPSLDFVLVVTGTLASQWQGLGDKVEIVEFDGDFSRVEEVVEAQKLMVKAGDERVGKPLFLFDDIGDKHSTKKGKGSELLDSFYMTLRNFGISVIAISQQQNK